MLAFNTGTSYLDMGEVAPYLLKQARERKGQWRIKLYDKKGNIHAVMYTEEEYSKISRTAYHGIRNGTKTSALLAGLENAAQVLWPTGSLDHVAMRHVGVHCVLQYVTSTTGNCFSWLLPCMYIPQRPALHRVGSKSEDKSPPAEDKEDEHKDIPPKEGGSNAGGKKTADEPHSKEDGTTADGEKASEGEAGKTNPDKQPKPDEPTPPTLEAPATPQDTEIGAELNDDNRTITRGDVVAIVGQNFDKKEPVNHLPIVGVMVGPCQVKPNVYAKTASNVKSAIEERTTKKQRKVTLSPAERARIGKVIRTSMTNHRSRGVFSKTKVQEWAVRHFDLETCKSGKWSIQRFRSSLENLYARERPTYSLKTDIKYECMPEGKAPRFLIADGDEGQLMALAVVRCFEDIMFEHFESKSIKHTDKRTAVDRAVRELRKKGAKVVEGDGAAWDATCGDIIRGLIENPVMRHISRVLSEFGVIPETWMEEHSAICEQKKLRLFFENKFETMRVTIDAIRRSGHRGTSCLNWWTNFVLWICSIFVEPERFLDPEIRKGKDHIGTSRWWNGCFEGDDSLCSLCPPMEEGDDLSAAFLKFWAAAGFNMKIVFCKERATFVGWHIGCNDGEINDYRSPELPRALANSGVCVSAEGVRAAKEGDRKAVSILASASALARASDFSGILPSVSRKYLDFAESLSSSNFSDREMSLRAFGEDGYGANEVRALINDRNLGITPQDEMATLKALGYPATHDEIQTFTEYGWSLDPSVLTDYDAFKASLPPTWRKKP